MSECYAEVYVRKGGDFEKKDLTISANFFSCHVWANINSSPIPIAGCFLKKGNLVKVVPIDPKYKVLNGDVKKLKIENGVFYVEAKLTKEAEFTPFDAHRSLRHVIRRVWFSNGYEDLLPYSSNLAGFYSDVAKEHRVDENDAECLLKEQALKTLAKSRGVSYREKTVSHLILSKKENAVEVVLNRNNSIRMELERRIKTSKKVKLEKELQENIMLLDTING